MRHLTGATYLTPAEMDQLVQEREDRLAWGSGRQKIARIPEQPGAVSAG
jgi:hypothetical protein